MITYPGGQLTVTLNRRTGLTQLARQVQAEAKLGFHETATVVYKGRGGLLVKTMPTAQLAQLALAEADSAAQLRVERRIAGGS
ncbi:hypothetical protein ACN20G_23545 [Streptomyces sp. BI20]|uniref:hypothetical protein n=1 Tax=Streptomyces sp. BI20 TaxID=3403460 RepID=UPI003C777C71